jgi:hypothetical protein
MTNTDHTNPATMHTPEPWHVTPGTPAVIFADYDTFRLGIADIGTFAPRGVQLANARRIVAAVNACQGIPTEALEQGVVAELLAALREAREEIEYWHADMLTEEERHHPRGSGWARVYDKISAALARATGAETPAIQEGQP